jgi:hypothetical protein
MWLKKNHGSTPPSSTTLRPVSDQIRHEESIPTLLWCSCAPWWSVFAGPSPGPRAPRHGRRNPSPPAMLHHTSWCTSPTLVNRRSCRSCRTHFPSAKPSSPARTRRSNTTATVLTRQGPHVKRNQKPRGLSVKPWLRWIVPQGPLCVILLQTLKFHINSRKNHKNAN